MDHALLKELRDAGCSLCFNQGDNDGIHIPTLSELIEACGEDFDYLMLMGRQRKERWCAHSHVQPVPEGDYINGYGKTPEEAVARLWLALNRTESAKS
jgi:hypothetical protein